MGLALALLLAASTASCSRATRSPDAEAGGPPPAYRAKCGSCHVPAEPGSVAPDALASVVDRHRHRVRLSDAEWRALAAFLAAQPSSSSAKASDAPPM